MAHRKPFMKRTLQTIAGTATQMAAWMVNILPASWADAFGRTLGKLAYRLSKKHRERTKSNLRMCFPEWTEQKIQKTAVDVFQHFGKTMVRILRSAKLKPEEVLQSVSAQGFELLEEALKQNKGVILITAHFGNWERSAHYITTRGYTLNVIARDANQIQTNKVLNQTRTRQGMKVLPRGAAAKDILRCLQRNECVGILPDQNAWEIYVDFFGIPAGTVTGPAVFHLRTGAPIITAFCVEQPNGKYQLTFEKVELTALTGQKNEDIHNIMQKINLAIENVIRKHPEQYLWMHDRWRAAREKGLLEPKLLELNR